MTCLSTYTINVGQVWQATLTVRDENDALVDLGVLSTLKFRITKQAAIAPDIFVLTIGAGITLRPQSGATLGQARIVATAMQTAMLSPGTYYCDIAATTSDGPLPVIEPTPLVAKAWRAP